MNGLLLIKDNLANKISYYHLLLFMVSLPFNLFYSHLILISFAIHTFIHLKPGDIKPVFKFRTLILTSVFIVTLLSTIYTINPTVAYQEWGKQITLLLFPLLFCINPLDVKKYRPNLLLALALICTLTITYLYYDALATIGHYHLPMSLLFSSYFTNHNFSQPIAIHATFFSMQVALALIYMLTLLLKKQSIGKTLFYLCCCLILSGGVIQLGAKSVVFAFIVAVNIAIPFFLLTGAKQTQFLLASAFITILLTAAVLGSGAFRDRYVKGFKEDLSTTVTGRTDDTRLARWKVSLGLIGKKPIIGYGAGSEIGLLQEDFFNRKLYNSYLNRLNTHSEYLSFLIKSGIIGLLIYVATLTWGFVVSLKRKDILFFTFLLVVTFVSASENLLDVDKGIIFYAFFFSFFTFSWDVKKSITKPLPTMLNNRVEATKQLVHASSL